MLIQYVGPHKAVDVPLPGNKWATVARGESIEVDDAHGKALLQQKENWEAKAAAKKSEPAAEKKGGES